MLVSAMSGFCVKLQRHCLDRTVVIERLLEAAMLSRSQWLRSRTENVTDDKQWVLACGSYGW